MNLSNSVIFDNLSGVFCGGTMRRIIIAIPIYTAMISNDSKSKQRKS